MLQPVHQDDSADRIQVVATRLAGLSVLEAFEEQIERYIRLGLVRPETDTEIGFEVLRRLKAEPRSWQLWPLYADIDGETKMFGALVTHIQRDWVFDRQDLLVFSFYADLPVEMSAWIEAWETIDEYRKARKCDGIVLYTDVPRVQEIAINLGFAKGQTQFRKGD